MLVLPPPQPAAANPRKSTVIANALPKARRFGRVIEADLPPSTNKKTKMAARVKRVAVAAGSVGNENGRVGSAKGTVAAVPVVVTMTVNGVAVPPETWSVDGPWMLAAVGAPP